MIPFAKILPYVLAILLLHVLGVALLIQATGAFPSLWGMALLAYTLGMRHAFDADHIAAIDNTVRRLLEAQRDPSGVGFFFALGHSSVVFLMAFLLAVATRQAQQFLPWFGPIGGVIGPTVSGVFLLVIALLNVAILADTLRTFSRVRRGESDSVAAGPPGGIFVRLTGPLFRLVRRSVHLYPIGFLFGLGFDTASEIALLTLSGGAASSSIPWAGVLALPLLFASGMTLFDTADGLIMARAYGWSASQPLRRMFYNLTVTGLSVMAALIVGAVQLLQVCQSVFALRGPFWGWVAGIDFGNLGFIMVGLFIVLWWVSEMVWRRLEATTP